MGRLAKLLSFTHITRKGAKLSDVKVDPGGGPNVTAEHFSSPGDDSYPLPGDYVALNSDSGSGRETAIGYLDPEMVPKSSAGDKRIYARDSSGAEVVEVWLKNTGEATISNANGSVILNPDGSIKGVNGAGSFELAASGEFIVNGVTIDTGGNITTSGTITGGAVVGSTSVTADGKELAGHLHTAGTPPGDTGPNK